MCKAFEEFDRQMESMRSQIADQKAAIADKDAALADKDAALAIKDTNMKKSVLHMLQDNLSLETITQYSCLEPREIYAIAVSAGMPLPV